jgi:uncharacterized coiled-coil DUF342 family protein
MIILEYDRTPGVSTDQKVSSLMESVQRALDDIAKNMAGVSKVQGDKGDIGLSLVSVTEYYLLSNLTEGVTVDTAGWSTDIPTMSPDNKYLWNYEVFTYSDGSTETMEPKIIGAYGETGVAGEPAPAIVTMTEQYYLSTSKTELVGGEWVRTMPEWTSGKYLWTRWCIEWSEPNPTTLTYSDPVVATSFNEIHEAADSAKTAAEEAKTEAENATSQVSQVNTELAQAQQELDALAENLETLESTMSTSYATKGELTAVETDLSSQVQQNAAQISQTVTQIQQIDIDASQALQDAADAAEAAATAQQNAIEAQNKYTQLKQQADVTDEQLAAAKEAVEQAQKAATEAGDAAAAAQSAADSLSDRVTTAESNMSQQAEQIAATVSRIEAAEAEVDSIVSEDLVDIRESITNLTLTADDISAAVTTIEQQQADMGDLMSQVEQITGLLIEDGKVTFDFTTIQKQVEDAVEELNRRNRYVNITDDETLGATITIGDSESGMVGRFTKTSLDFLSGDTVIASYANDGLTTENITTNNQLKFGGNWAIRPGTNGNLNDVWIGG